MEFAFYICGLIAILATLRVVTHTNPVHALLYLIISLLAIAGVFFSLGAYFAGALEIIVYAGAIMVLFVFVVMMLNLGRHRDRTGAQVAAAGDLDWPGHPLRGAAGGYRLRHPRALTTGGIDGAAINAKEVGIALFGPYVLAVELASMLLLAGLGGCLPHWPRRARRRGAEQPSERQRQTKNGGTRMIPLTHGLILAAILFVLGLTGLVIRRNLLFMLISLGNHD
ncbi:NADH-quinone oxidoreductase subunit J [Klebsiella pneumoniae]|uniref:NADH-quinone oxidoreductase subunit J n=1 Tax=Klebsiella pneumoniae TaxID=573 RepID=A0A927DNG0_KLEPN|nr:NADH-quinone oxidoreductase subunit J [Klebsiella pneumoniae]